jgi:uncharacterized membrane protein (DUF373 family)
MVAKVRAVCPDRSEDRMSQSEIRHRYADFRQTWLTLGLYERIEQIVSLALTTLIAVIVIMATLDLAREVIALMLVGALDPLDHRVFQALFGQIMTLLIAMEFKHSILEAVAHRQSIVQVKTVILIALLAVARKFIILDAPAYPPMTIFALAAVMLALGFTYWLVRDRNTRAARA